MSDEIKEAIVTRVRDANSRYTIVFNKTENFGETTENVAPTIILSCSQRLGVDQGVGLTTPITMDKFIINKIMKTEKNVINAINNVDSEDIREQHYITQDNERRDRIEAQATRYAYAMKELIEERNKTDSVDGKKELALKYLMEHDKHFVNTAVVTLSWLQLWFLLHWLLYIISTFMILTVLIDAVALHVKEKVPHVEPGVGFHPVQIVFLCLYSLVQCFVLVYPCLRAAGVTRTRQRVIRKISDEAYKFTNLPQGVIPEFLESMKRRKFGFRFRILCASITFNLNIAYLSIAFGFVGIVVSLVNSVTS